MNPLCVECMKKGISKSAVVMDHIEPHRGNVRLLNDPKNRQGLCIVDHNIKSAKEKKGRGIKFSMIIYI